MQGSQGASMGPHYHGTPRSESPGFRAGQAGCRSGGPQTSPAARLHHPSSRPLLPQAQTSQGALPDRAGEKGGLGRRHPSEWVCPPSHSQLLWLHFPGGVCGRGDLGRVPRAPQVRPPLGVGWRGGGLAFLSRGTWEEVGVHGWRWGRRAQIPRPGLTERAARLRGAGCGKEEGRGPAGPSRGRGAPRRLLPAPPARRAQSPVPQVAAMARS